MIGIADLFPNARNADRNRRAAVGHQFEDGSHWHRRAVVQKRCRRPELGHPEVTAHLQASVFDIDAELLRHGPRVSSPIAACHHVHPLTLTLPPHAARVPVVGAGQWIRGVVSRYVDRRLGDEFHHKSQALTLRQNEYGFDPFGLSRDHLRYVALASRWLYRDYFRTETRGIEEVPDGRVLLVANHSGQLPFDGVVIGAALYLERDPPRVVRSMVDSFVPDLPFASYLFNRWGQITGTPENCRRLLADDAAILVFPEGSRGVSKPFSKRYQLQEFGLGFMRLALETRTPIVPIAVIGAEEKAPAINFKPLAKLLGTPAFPLVPYPPFVPILPLPVKYRLYFGAPMHFSGDPDDDDDVLRDLVREVSHRIQSMLHQGLRERKGVFR